LRKINKIALLVFIRDAHDEARVKPIFKGDNSRNNQLYTYLNQRIVSVAENSSYDFYVVSTQQQVGEAFAQRFKNAFKSIFEMGYDAVVSVGNDVPQVNTQTISDVVTGFESHDVVIGKTTSNGAYTVGLTKYAFSKCDFDAVDWSSNNVVRSIEKRSNEQGSSYLQLENTFYEINSHHDLRIFIKCVQQCEITFQGVLFLIGLFYGKHEVESRNQSIINLLSSSSFEIRGSPYLQ
jgi:2-phospho-L-lactate guanylyltransferase (CobY/MobA/RfbA family)